MFDHHENHPYLFSLFEIGKIGWNSPNTNCYQVVLSWILIHHTFLRIFIPSIFSIGMTLMKTNNNRRKSFWEYLFFQFFWAATHFICINFWQNPWRFKFEKFSIDWGKKIKPFPIDTHRLTRYNHIDRKKFNGSRSLCSEYKFHQLTRPTVVVVEISTNREREKKIWSSIQQSSQWTQKAIGVSWLKCILTNEQLRLFPSESLEQKSFINEKRRKRRRSSGET